jgi:hypothetical protein
VPQSLLQLIVVLTAPSTRPMCDCVGNRAPPVVPQHRVGEEKRRFRRRACDTIIRKGLTVPAVEIAGLNAIPEERNGS